MERKQKYKKNTKNPTRDSKKENRVSSAKLKKTVIVVGDLFIDENWLMATTDNYHSTDVGDTHYTSLMKGPDSFVLSVCGIANVLKVLCGDETARDEVDNMAANNDNDIAKESFRDKYSVIGIGAWNPMDTARVKRILCPIGKKELFATPYTLTDNLDEVGCDKCKSCLQCKYNYELRNIVKDTEDSRVGTSTNRIFRLYEGFGSDHPKLRYRFDWQIDIEKKHIDYSVLDGMENVEAIVIVDHGKGVITDEVIAKLLSKKSYQDAKWYIRTKMDSPSWFKKLKSKSKTLRLLVADQQLINHTFGERMWYRSTSLCRASLELLGSMLGLATYRHGIPVESELIKSDNAVILFEENWAIAGSRHRNNSKKSIPSDDARIYYMPKSSDEKASIRVGRTSIFFNSLIYMDLMKSELEESKMLIAMEWALRNMNQWMQKCTEAWRDENPSALSGPFEQVISWNKSVDSMIEIRNGSITQNYNNSWREWNLSSTHLGILSYKPDEDGKSTGILAQEDDDSTVTIKEFHLWRSYGTLQNYICPGGEKRSNINNLVSLLNEFRKKQDPVVPFNSLFIAEPGWGKSYLAQCISEYFDFDFLSYAIAQMASTKELIDSFKEIASTQKRSKKKTLVFMDEIDATINTQIALGLLLSPMWDGKFKSEGYTNKIDPCIWIFACTKPLSEIRKLPKGRDFLSRINGPLINLDFLSNKDREELHKIDEEEARNTKLVDTLSSIDTREQKDPGGYHNNKRTEIVFQAVNLLNEHFGPIKGIDLNVLNLFYDILPINGMRSLQIFASKFSNIARGIIEKTNVPKLLNNRELEEQIKLLQQDVYEDIFIANLAKKGETIKIKLQT